ncbi:hypothetical protein [Nocardia beijingensis]|uniref:hypothetical protein n=1 Tax=Nocardia beijingensis TaxID=95162 RepID=UPI00339F7ACC
MANFTQFDALQWLCYRLKSTVDWTTDSIWGSLCDGDHEAELDSISDLVEQMNAVMRSVTGHWGTYSDGRQVITTVEIERGHSFTNLWSPDRDIDAAQTITGKLFADPGEDRGSYQIQIIPPQTVEVRVLRLEKGGRS